MIFSSSRIFSLFSTRKSSELTLFCFSYPHYCCQVLGGDISRICQSLWQPPAVQSDGSAPIVILRGSTGPKKKTHTSGFKRLQRDQKHPEGPETLETTLKYIKAPAAWPTPCDLWPQDPHSRKSDRLASCL